MDTILISPAPDPASVSAATALQERRFHVLKNDDTFAILDSIGDMLAVPGSNDGLYFHDTRYLSQLSLLVGGARPLLLSSALGADNLMLTANLTNAHMRDVQGEAVEQGLVHIRRSVFLAGSACFSRLALFNYGMQPHDLMVQLGFEADFADLFEVRGMHRPHRGTRSATVLARDTVQAGYVGLDHVVRATRLRFDPVPHSLAPDAAGFRVHLPAGGRATLFMELDCTPDVPQPLCPEPHLRRPAVAGASGQPGRRRAHTASLAAEDGAFDEAVGRAASDLRMLTTSKPTGPYPYAGIPWFSTAFGRDALITALLVLWQDPSLARGVLGYLAQEQATDFDPASDAEPGKILHEVRAGEMAELREVPFRRYYGSVDATPLFVMLAGAYLERTGDIALLRGIWPNIEAALGWMDRGTDASGFLCYHRMTEDGLANQGWKDSYDSISHADGTLATGRIALCEVQGYVYAARRAGAAIARRLGQADRALALDAGAEQLRQAFEGTVLERAAGELRPGAGRHLRAVRGAGLQRRACPADRHRLAGACRPGGSRADVRRLLHRLGHPHACGG